MLAKKEATEHVVRSDRSEWARSQLPRPWMSLRWRSANVESGKYHQIELPTTLVTASIGRALKTWISLSSRALKAAVSNSLACRDAQTGYRFVLDAFS